MNGCGRTPGVVLASHPEAFRGLLDDAEMLAAYAPGGFWVRVTMREMLLMIRYGREVYKFWDCV